MWFSSPEIGLLWFIYWMIFISYKKTIYEYRMEYHKNVFVRSRIQEPPLQERRASQVTLIGESYCGFLERPIAGLENLIAI